MANSVPPDYRAMARVKPLCEQIGRQRIAAVVHAFYDRLRVHPELEHFFSVIHDWPAHEELIVEYWWVVLGGDAMEEREFAMADKHRALNLAESDFDLWLDCLRETLVEQLEPHLAAQWEKHAKQVIDFIKPSILGR
ncbi:MAG: group III truncated hemoglobin [Gammaproteobacteria bacterium]|nr:group III truncated hemoglobin [Gammaproteobacteria bacterium]